MDININMNKDKVWKIILFVVLPFTTLFYSFITGHIWEDFFITFKFSKNLVDGYGLVYHPGEHVHGFTSVINTLLPAFFYWITGKSLIATIWLYRISSIVALIYGAWFFLKEYDKKNKNTFLIIIFFILVFAFEAKTIMFTTNGQEAGFMALFLLPSVIFAFNGYEKNWRWAGVAWAGLIYTRPDGVVYILILAISAIVFGNSRNKNEYKAIFKAGWLCAALYLPWFIGVWMYYGSPIPHTITAKATLGLNVFNDIIFTIQTVLSFIPQIGPTIFQPTYFHFGGWPYWISVYGFFVWSVSMFYWLLPSSDKFGRFISFLFALLVLYLAILQFRGGIYPWYLPPAAILGSFVLISAIFQLSKKAFNKNQNIAMYAMSIIFVFASSSVYFMTVTQISVQQELIEYGNRMKIGLWLNKNKKPGDSVFLEPLGYIGYFSNAKMLDWPGLVSTEVVQAEAKKMYGRYEPILKKLKPTWLVLRPNDYANLENSVWFKENYKIQKVFDVREQIQQYKYLPGINYLYVDSVFFVFESISEKQ